MPKRAIEISIDRIRAWLNDPDSKPEDLPQKDRDIYERWDYCYDQLKIEKPAAVVSRLMHKYSISKAQAYIDIKNSQSLLNPINRLETEWIRSYVVEDALLQIKTARETGNHKAWQKARTDLIKIYQIERNEKEGIDPAQLGNNNYVIAINLGDEIQKIDMNKLIDTPHEKKEKLTDFLFKDIDIEDAEEIMNS